MGIYTEVSSHRDEKFGKKKVNHENHSSVGTKPKKRQLLDIVFFSKNRTQNNTIASLSLPTNQLNNKRLHKIHSFKADLSEIFVPKKLNNPFDYEPDLLCLAAAEQLQEHLTTQTEWNHNFGLSDDTSRPIGKMFGVLVIQNADKELGFLAAFSGKLAGQNHHLYFVPPVYDSLSDEGFLNNGMQDLKVLNDQVKQLNGRDKETNPLNAEEQNQLQSLKQQRKKHSKHLLTQLFDAYSFVNAYGEYKTAAQLFSTPPAGAGECSAPKLLQYAYLHHLKPIAIAEFWWGAPPSNNNTIRQHGHYYGACLDKCSTILRWMLS
jgi:tRNA pseudouridine32 synthase/23S rRNA pseudouridine746 synthase